MREEPTEAVVPKRARSPKPVLLIVLAGAAVAACASTRNGSKPVPPHAIETAADTKVPDAGDAAAPAEGDAAASASAK